MTYLPRRLIKPHLTRSFTAARPLENGRAESNCWSIASFPCLSMKTPLTVGFDCGDAVVEIGRHIEARLNGKRSGRVDVAPFVAPLSFCQKSRERPGLIKLRSDDNYTRVVYITPLFIDLDRRKVVSKGESVVIFWRDNKSPGLVDKTRLALLLRGGRSRSRTVPVISVRAENHRKQNNKNKTPCAVATIIDPYLPAISAGSPGSGVRGRAPSCPQMGHLLAPGTKFVPQLGQKSV